MTVQRAVVFSVVKRDGSACWFRAALLVPDLSSLVLSSLDPSKEERTPRSFFLWLLSFFGSLQRKKVTACSLQELPVVKELCIFSLPPAARFLVENCTISTNPAAGALAGASGRQIRTRGGFIKLSSCTIPFSIYCIILKKSIGRIQKIS